MIIPKHLFYHLILVLMGVLGKKRNVNSQSVVAELNRTLPMWVHWKERILGHIPGPRSGSRGSEIPPNDLKMTILSASCLLSVCGITRVNLVSWSLRAELPSCIWSLAAFRTWIFLSGRGLSCYNNKWHTFRLSQMWVCVIQETACWIWIVFPRLPPLVHKQDRRVLLQFTADNQNSPRLPEKNTLQVS